jgi:hypothetical protein
MSSSAVLIGPELKGRDKWLGGELGSDGNIYGVSNGSSSVSALSPLIFLLRCQVPGSAKSVVKIEVETGEVTLMGENLKGPYVQTSYPTNQFKWLRGARAIDGAIYGVPSNADAVLKIIPSTGECKVIGGPFRGHWKWHGGVIAPDGNIYGIPCNAEQVPSRAARAPAHVMTRRNNRVLTIGFVLMSAWTAC